MAKISEPESWDKKLGEAELAINNTKNRSINDTPSRVLFGINQRGTVSDKIMEYIQHNSDKQRNLDEIRDNAAQSIQKSQETNKIAYDSAHKSPHVYQVNDLVMVSNYDCTPGVSKKLLPKYRGPYRVAQVLPNDRYIVTDVENWQVTQKPYKGMHAPAQMRRWVRAT